MLRPARAALSALCALGAAAAASTLTAHAFDTVQSFDPVPAGQGYTYYVIEHDFNNQPVQGRAVTISVQRAPGRDAAVAPGDAKGIPTGAWGQTATQVSGADGLAYFLLRTSTTPGENDFTWQDGTYTGQAVVIGRPLAAATAGRKAGATAAPKPAPTPLPLDPAAARSQLPSAAVPPLAVALLATLLVWLFLPPVLARRL